MTGCRAETTIYPHLLDSHASVGYTGLYPSQVRSEIMKLSSFAYFAGFGIRTILFKEKKPILGTVIVTDKCNLSCRRCSVNNIGDV